MAEDRARKKRLGFAPDGPPNKVGLNIYAPISKAAVSEFVLLPPDLQWRPASAFGILRQSQPEIWHAGHVNAVVGIGDVAVVGSQTGGVWLISPAYGAIPQHENFPARSLSWDWANPHVTTLAPGPDGPMIVYAGGDWIDGANSSLHVVKLAQVLGGVEFVAAAEVPVPFLLSINQVVVHSNPRRIVVASTKGVWWSAIPADPMNVGGYLWRRALNISGDVSGIALGAGDTVVAALDGTGVAGSNKSGFLVGTWTGATLTFTPSTITGGVPPMQRTSIASCKSQHSVLYAVSAAADDQFLGAVFRSADGGKTFSQCQVPSGAGNLGFYNNCIEVHPTNSDIVALGWRTGPFISTDRGQTWANTSDTPGHLHSDVHSVSYAETSSGVSLWVGTDGGVCLSTDGGASWDSRYNKHLRNLQYYGPVDQLGMSPFDTNRWRPGVHGGATQDNGNLWTRSGDEGIRSAVRQFEGGDGNTVLFVTDTIVLHRNNTLTVGTTEIGNRIRRSNYRPATDDMDDPIGPVVPAQGYPDGLPTPSAAATVGNPHYVRNGARMLAVFGVGTEVHGYLGSAAPGSFVKLADIGGSTPAAPRTITAIASLDGHRVLVGTSDGQIYSIDSATGTITDQNTRFDGYAGNKISRILWPNPSVRFATVANSAVARWLPNVSITVDGKRGLWVLTKGLLTSGATDLEFAELETGGSALFATTDFGVEVSIDDGASWTVIRRGLPKRPHCRDIRLGTNGEGRPTLYVGTYGWGAFMAELPRKAEGKFGHIPDEVADILLGVIAGGGGVEIVGGRIKVVPPHEPARALAIALVMLALSQRSGEETAALTERSAVEVLQIAGIDGIDGLEQLLASGRSRSADDERADDDGSLDGESGAERSAPPIAE
jgi:hypothetical protein